MGDLRNLPTENPEAMADLIDIRQGVGMTLFAFDEGEAIVMPEGIPHSVKVITPFKMLLTVVKP